MKNIILSIPILFVSFFIKAQNTYVPDDNFEQALIDKGYDVVLDNYVSTSNINTITSLSVSRLKIADLTGIEDFVSLMSLNCSENQLTNLVVSENTALTGLYCYENQLTSLDVSTNTALTGLYCYENQLTSLDVSTNIALIGLNCHDNELTSLDISKNTALTHLNCYINQLSSLDVSTNTVLIELTCGSNYLKSLDVSTNTVLTKLTCENNQLTGLDVKNGNNTAITDFNTINNSGLTCVEVDDVTWSTENWTNIGSQTSFSKDCGSLSTSDYQLENFKVYPIPSESVVNITVLETVKYQLVNVKGKVLRQGDLVAGVNHLNFESVLRGVYFFIIKNNNTFQSKKIVLK